jgi:hypothetical protein
MQKENRFTRERIAQKREEALNDFVSFLDSNFYEGYAQQLAKENPCEFTLQLNEYIENYFSHAV